MWPILFSLGSINFYSLAFFLGVGFLLSSFLIWRRLKELGLQEEKVLDLVVSLTVFGLVTARIFFILQNLADFGLFTERWFLWGRYPGFSFWGGLGGVIFVLKWFAKKEKRDFWLLADEVTLGLLPFLFLAQIGSFFDGSSQGRPTVMPWGLYFPGDFLRRQPVSFLTAMGLFLIWLFLLRIERQWRIWPWYKSKANGLMTLTFLALFSLINFVVAFWHDSPLYFYWLEIILSGLTGAVVLVIFYLRSGRKEAHDKKSS